MKFARRAAASTAGSPLFWEVRGAEGNLLLHLWAENCDVTRRVLAIADQSDAKLALAVEWFGRAKLEWREMVRLDFVRSPKDLPAKIFANHCDGFWPNNFPMKLSRKFLFLPVWNIPCPACMHAELPGMAQFPWRFWRWLIRNHPMRWKAA